MALGPITTALADYVARRSIVNCPASARLLQSVLDSVTVLLDDPAVRAGGIKRIAVDIPTGSLASSITTPSPIFAYSTSSRR